MNKKLIRLTENDIHRIVKESVNRIINEIGDTDKGQDALGQVRGRADKRSKLLGGAIGNKYRKISHDAQEKAYSQGKKHGFDIHDPNGAYDKGISKGYDKATTNESDLHRIVKESVNKVIKEGLWDGIEQNGYQIHDQFVDFIKDYYAKGDNQLAYQIEDDVNGWLAKMMEDLDNKYGSTMA